MSRHISSTEWVESRIDGASAESAPEEAVTA